MKKLKLNWYINYKPVRYPSLSGNLARRFQRCECIHRVFNTQDISSTISRDLIKLITWRRTVTASAKIKKAEQTLCVSFLYVTRGYLYIFVEGLANQFSWSNLFIYGSVINIDHPIDISTPTDLRNEKLRINMFWVSFFSPDKWPHFYSTWSIFCEWFCFCFR